MNIRFAEVKEENVSTEEGIFLDGEQIGTISLSPCMERADQYHAVLRVEGGELSITQGHGETKKKAVANAISNGRRKAVDRLVALEELQGKLTGSGEVLA